MTKEEANIALIESAGVCDERAIIEALAAGADVNARSGGGTTALMLAAAKGSVECVQLLIAAGADIDASDDDCQNALSLAIESSAHEVVKLLADAGAADWYDGDAEGLT